MYIPYCESYYDGGRHTANIKSGLGRFFAGWGHLSLSGLSTPTIAQIRDRRAREGELSRPYINKLLGYVGQFARWAAEYGLAPASIVQEVDAVRKLRRGAHGATEPERVEPASADLVELVRSQMRPQLRAYLDMMRLTGMRPGEARIMRAGDCELVATDAMVYTPRRHKTAHHGRARYIAIVGPAFDLTNRLIHQVRSSSLYQDAEYLFSPDGSGRRPYAEFSIAQAVRKLCDELSVERLRLNQLRHAYASDAYERGHERKDIGRVLGHSNERTTGIYIHESKRRVVEEAIRLAG